MIKKQLIFICLLLFFSFSVYAEKTTESKFGRLVQSIADSERQQMKSTLNSWTDKEKVEAFSKKNLSEEYIKNLYKQFKNTIVNPPNPDEYTEYTIPNAKESLKKVEKLGKKMQNLFKSLSDEEFKKYGRLIAEMRAVLYTDWKHIPYAIKHNNARDIYWYRIHKSGVEAAEEEYKKCFGKGKIDRQLLEAVKEGDTESVKELLGKGADVNAKDEDGGTALMWAAAKGNKDIVKKLLAQEADVNAKSQTGKTALIAAAEKDQTEIAKDLMQAGAEVNTKDRNGRTALMWAAYKGHPEVIKLLIAHEVNVNIADRYGMTALKVAKKKGHTDIVRLLKQAGAKE